MLATEQKFKIDFIGIGAAKSGTTWLANRLADHPDVCLSEPKEVKYFNDKTPMADRHLYGHTKNPYRKKPLSWYDDHFRHCKHGKRKGEFSPIYLIDEEAPRNIHANFPDAKIILCVRNPIERVYSHYWMYRNFFKIEHRTFEQAINNEPYYIEIGRYYKHLKRYLAFFKKEQIKIILFDDIRDYPENVLHTIFDFLGISQVINKKKLYQKDNVAKRMRSRTIIKLMENTSRLLVHTRAIWLLQTIKRLGISKLIMRLNKIDKTSPPMSLESRSILQQIYKQDIIRLSGFIERDLDHWE